MQADSTLAKKWFTPPTLHVLSPLLLLTALANMAANVTVNITASQHVPDRCFVLGARSMVEDLYPRKRRHRGALRFEKTTILHFEPEIMEVIFFKKSPLEGGFAGFAFIAEL